MAGPRCSSANARLHCDDLPRLGCRSVACRWCADHLHVVTTLPRTLCQAAIVETLKKTSSKLIEGAGFEIPAVLPATRLWRILSKPESAQCHSRIRRESGREIASAVIKRSIATFCANTASSSTIAIFGIEANATLDSRFQRWSLGKQLFPGALPQGLDETRPWH